MPIPTPVTTDGVRGLAAIIGAPRRAAIVFDFDGVLSPIVDDPERAYVDQRALAGLSRLAPLVGAIAIITGRPAAVVVALGGFAQRPELARLTVFGHYGRERWDGRTGRVHAPPPTDGVVGARAELPGLLRSLGLAGEVRVEDKGSSVAVHTRASADPIGLLDRLREPVRSLAARHGLLVEPGRMVLELRPAGVDKGQALREFVTEVRAGAVAYTGDDLGDLAAFAAVDALRADGVPGVKICSGSTEAIEVAHRADLVVDGPAGVADLLEGLADALAGAHPDAA